jgi:hypothetical protein
MKTTCAVVVVYDNPEMRELAEAFCDRLMKRHWAKLNFDVGWWSFESLGGGDAAKIAASKSAQADLVLFAARPQKEFPFHVRSWAETWIRERSDREGSLVGLPTPDQGDPPEAAAMRSYLRALAHRAGMDYLTEIPEELVRAIPESLEVFAQRANQVTDVLDEILHHPPPVQRSLL